MAVIVWKGFTAEMVICLVVCVGAEMGVYYVSVYGLLFEGINFNSIRNQHLQDDAYGIDFSSSGLGIVF